MNTTTYSVYVYLFTGKYKVLENASKEQAEAFAASYEAKGCGTSVVPQN